MKLVIIESPFAATTMEQAARHIAYARAALRDSLMRGEAPFASHLLEAAEKRGASIFFRKLDPARMSALIEGRS